MPYKHNYERKLNISLLSIFHIKMMGFKTWVLDFDGLNSKARCATVSWGI